MKSFIPIVLTFLLCQCSINPAANKASDGSTGTQTDWVLGAIDGKHRNGRVVVVDKRAATITGFDNSKKVFSFPALLARSRKDHFNTSISAFSQGVTPATYYKNPQIMYNPKFPGFYKESTVVAFNDIIKVGGKTEVLSFHSTLSGSNDRNVSDGNSGNNRISNGCIRVRHSDYLKMIAFMSPGGDLDELRKAQKAGKPRNITSKAAVVILPEEDRSFEGTLETLGL